MIFKPHFNNCIQAPSHCSCAVKWSQLTDGYFISLFLCLPTGVVLDEQWNCQSGRYPEEWEEETTGQMLHKADNYTYLEVAVVHYYS